MEPLDKTLQLSVIPADWVGDIKNEISEIKTLLTQKRQEEERTRWITKEEACIRLDVCSKTLNKYLNRGIIPFSKYGGKVMIQSSDIEAHLKTHYCRSTE